MNKSLLTVCWVLSWGYSWEQNSQGFCSLWPFVLTGRGNNEVNKLQQTRISESIKNHGESKELKVNESELFYGC